MASTRCPKTGRFSNFRLRNFRLSDDGAMDTVVVCSACGEELRYNYVNSETELSNSETELSDDDYEAHYNEFVEWALVDAAEQHERTLNRNKAQMNCPKCGGTGQVWDEIYHQTIWRCVSCSHQYGMTKRKKPKLPRVPVPKPTQPHGSINQKQTKLRKERERDE
jgi:uncharacterized protein (DUF983 family)